VAEDKIQLFCQIRAEDEETVNHRKFNTTQHDHRNTPMDKIRAWFVLKLHKAPKKKPQSGA
jgi:hypothetical protein